MVRGYHVYKDIWDASSSIGEDFICKREPGNQNDTHAMAITKEDVILAMYQEQFHQFAPFL